jgi:hypothetical protein
MVGAGVSEGVTTGGVAIGEACEVGAGVTDACCAVGALLADGLGLVVAGDVQPLIDTTRTRAPIKSRGNAYLSIVLVYRFIILATGFIFFHLRFLLQPGLYATA